MSENSKIESVYEPGFGSMGKPEDNVMFENSIGVYKLNEKSRENYQKILDNEGWEATPRDIVLFAEKKGGVVQKNKAEVVLNHAVLLMMRNPAYPKVIRHKSLGENSFQTQEINPAQLVSFTKNYIHTNKESSGEIELPLEHLVFCQAKGASDAEYLKARKMLVDEANKALQIFEANFRIPQFPPEESLKSI